MQSKSMVFSLMLGALVLGIVGFIPNAFAATEYTVSDRISCEALPVFDSEGVPQTATWSIPNRCIIDGTLVLEKRDTLIINFGVTLEISPTGNFPSLLSPIIWSMINIGTIEIAGDEVLDARARVTVENFGILRILPGSHFTNDESISGTGTIEINSGGTLVNDGNLETDLINNFGSIINNQLINSFGTFNHNQGATITNYGDIGATNFNIDGILTNNGVISVSRGVTTILQGGTIDNNNTLNIDVLGTVENLGTINNSVDEKINNDGIINNQASGEFYNNGFLDFDNTGVYNNFGLLQNNPTGKITLTSNDGGATNQQFSTINTSGTLDNAGTITNQCGEINGTVTGLIGPTDVIDACPLFLEIISPINDASFDDVTPILFLGIGVDKNAFGDVENFTSAIVWTDTSTDVIDHTGGIFIQTLSTPPNNHHITAELIAQSELVFVNIKIGILDADGDKHSPTTGDDCDDSNPNRFDGNPEIVDGIDNDCNGDIPLTEIDNDGDFYIDDDSGTFNFNSWRGDMFVIGADDCNDADPTISPGNVERNDGLDTNCDGYIPITELDDDEDGQRPYQGDCDDTNPLRFFGNPEVHDGIDNDCDGEVVDHEFDHDGDGYIEYDIVDPNHIDPNVIGGGDCDDRDTDTDNDGVLDGSLIHPDATEVLGDEIDNDCDGIVDLGDKDVDDDGYFSNGTGLGFDCDDTNPNRFDGNPEIVDGIDNDCDELEELLATEIDGDGDGYIEGPFDPSVPRSDWRDINHTPDGDGDCDDGDGLRYPTNLEVPDGIDNDCDLTIPIDEVDHDGDGYIEFSIESLNPPFHVDPNVMGGFDCNDDNDAVFPGAPERNDGLDNDCDGDIPPGESDDDGDGYFVGIDCDDDNSNRFPGNPEIVDGIDNDCTNDPEFEVDGLLLIEIDDDGDKQIIGPFELDEDDNPIWRGDVFPENNDGDCNDENESVYFGAPEIDNGRDDNCDGIPDDGLDLDGDTFTPLFGGDCLDVLSTDVNDPYFDYPPEKIHPDVPELSDGEIDNNCDGILLITDKHTSPEYQENLDDKTVSHYEKMMEDLEKEIKKLEDKNRKLEKKAVKEQEKIDKENLDEVNPHLQHKQKILDEIASNESLIDINDRQIHVIDVSINDAIVDERTLVVAYDNLTYKASKDILRDIEHNFKEIEKLAEKVVKEQEKIDEEEGKGHFDHANEHLKHMDQALAEIEIIEDLNFILKCAIDFIPEMLEKDEPNENDKVESLTVLYTMSIPETITINVTDKKDDIIISKTIADLFDPIVVDKFDFDKHKFDSEIFFTADGTTEKLHVSCSQPLFVGQTFGGYIISNLETRNGNNSCGGHDE